MPPDFRTPRLFKERLIPDGARLAGYAALVQALRVASVRDDKVEAVEQVVAAAYSAAGTGFGG